MLEYFVQLQSFRDPLACQCVMALTNRGNIWVTRIPVEGECVDWRKLALPNAKPFPQESPPGDSPEPRAPCEPCSSPQSLETLERFW